MVLDIESAECGRASIFKGGDAIVWSAVPAVAIPAVPTRLTATPPFVRWMRQSKRTSSVTSWSRTTELAQTTAFQALLLPLRRGESAADAYLRGTELNWTILGPTTLTLDEPTGKISLGSTVGRDAERGTVSRGNVARTIVASLKYDGTIGKVCLQRWRRSHRECLAALND